MAKVDLLLVPTALHHYTVEEIAEEERNSDRVCSYVECTLQCLAVTPRKAEFQRSNTAMS